MKGKVGVPVAPAPPRGFPPRPRPSAPRFLPGFFTYLRLPPEGAELGYSICEDLANGVPQQVTLDAIYENTNENVDVDDATFLCKAAILHLC